MSRITKKNRQFNILDFYQEDLWGRLRARDFKRFKRTKFNFFSYKRTEQTLLTEFLAKLGTTQNRYEFFDKIRKKRLIPSKTWFLNAIMAPKNAEQSRAISKTREKLKLDPVNFASVGLQKFSYQITLDKPQRRRRKLSRFAYRLKQRHKLRKFASCMNVRQFRNYIKKAKKKSSFILSFFKMFESRLDIFIYRINLFNTSGSGRQMISHGNFMVNGKIICFCNYPINLYDVVSCKDKQKYFTMLYEFFGYGLIILSVPRYIEVNYRILSAIMYRTPRIKELYYPSKIKAQFIASAGSRFN